VGSDVTATPGGRRVAGPGWSLRAKRVEPVRDGGWAALIEVREGLMLLVTEHGGPHVAAWAGEPERSDGVAVIEAGDGALGLARVPLCACGIRGCGNAGIQFSTSVADSRLPGLVDLLRDLPWTQAVPDRSNVLRGASLAAVSGVPDDPEPPGTYRYAYSPVTGSYYFPERPGRAD
jgi:hypothetical protein